MVSLDWVKMGWGKDFSSTPSSTLPFTMDFSASTESNVLPIDATVDAVRRIADSYPAPFTLMLSGGVDSQAMLHAWVKSGVPFKTLTVVYVDNEGKPFNTHDLETIPVVAGKFGVSIQYRTFELIKFIETELEDYVIRNQCISPQICAHMKMSEMTQDGTVVFSGNPFTHYPNLDYTIMGLHRYTINSKRNIIPFFFLHDPEVVGSCRKFFTGLDDELKDKPAYERKVIGYSRAGFDVVPQPTKMTGFELVKDYYDKKPDLVSFRDRLEFAKYPSRRVFDLRYRYYFTRKVKYVEKIINLPPKRNT